MCWVTAPFKWLHLAKFILINSFYFITQECSFLCYSKTEQDSIGSYYQKLRPAFTISRQPFSENIFASSLSSIIAPNWNYFKLPIIIILFATKSRWSLLSVVFHRLLTTSKNFQGNDSSSCSKDFLISLMLCLLLPAVEYFDLKINSLEPLYCGSVSQRKLAEHLLFNSAIIASSHFEFAPTIANLG